MISISSMLTSMFLTHGSGLLLDLTCHDTRCRIVPFSSCYCGCSTVSRNQTLATGLFIAPTEWILTILLVEKAILWERLTVRSWAPGAFTPTRFYAFFFPELLRRRDFLALFRLLRRRDFLALLTFLQRPVLLLRFLPFLHGVRRLRDFLALLRRLLRPGFFLQ